MLEEQALILLCWITTLGLICFHCHKRYFLGTANCKTGKLLSLSNCALCVTVSNLLQSCAPSQVSVSYWHVLCQVQWWERCLLEFGEKPPLASLRINNHWSALGSRGECIQRNFCLFQATFWDRERLWGILKWKSSKKVEWLLRCSWQVCAPFLSVSSLPRELRQKASLPGSPLGCQVVSRI